VYAKEGITHLSEGGHNIAWLKQQLHLNWSLTNQ